MLFWFLLIVPIVAFDPTLSGFRLTLLLDEVPEKVITDWDHSDLRLLNYIHYTPQFIRNFDQYKYILNTSEEEFNELNREMYSDQDHWVKRKVHEWRARIENQIALVQLILRRHHVYAIYLVENKLHNYLMLVDLRSGYKASDFVSWITSYQSGRLIVGKNWCDRIDYTTEVMFVKVGETIGVCDGERVVQRERGTDHDEVEQEKDEL